MRTLARWLVMICAVAALPSPCRAGAWTQKKGKGQVIFNFVRYETGATFDNDGRRAAFDNNGRFTKFETNPYLEVGLTDRVTLVGSFAFPSLTFEDSSNRFHSFGAGDQEIGLRLRLNPSESRTAWSLQGAVKVPAYGPEPNPQPGNRQVDYEGRLLVGRGFRAGSGNAFWNLEGALRHRAGFPADQFRGDATLGYNVRPRCMAVAQFFSIKGLENNSSILSGTNPGLNPSFDLYKSQLSVVWRVGGGARVQAGWARDLAGRRTGAGNALLLALWKEF